MIRPPPRPTLFPTPTLSRSRSGKGARCREGRFPPAKCRVRTKSKSSGNEHMKEILDTLEERRAGAKLGGGEKRIDRKSTRLNSSHQIISYAVFCLKKKTPKQ